MQDYTWQYRTMLDYIILYWTTELYRTMQKYTGLSNHRPRTFRIPFQMVQGETISTHFFLLPSILRIYHLFHHSLLDSHHDITQNLSSKFSKNEKSMKKTLPTFWVHRVYCIQNYRHNITINEFLTVWKMQHRSKRYLQIWEIKRTENWRYDALFLKPLKTH